VQYGRLLEPFRVFLKRSEEKNAPLGFLNRLLLFHVLPSARRTRWAIAPARMLQRFGLDRLLRKAGLLRLLPRRLRQLHEMLPPWRRRPAALPERLPAIGKLRARVAFFTGCVGDSVFPDTNLATARVLQQNGCEVWIPRNQVCCGAIHYHSGDEHPAQKLAATNTAAFADSFDALVVNAAGCGAMLKDYGSLLQDSPHAEVGKKLAAKVRDVSEFLVELGLLPPTHPLPLRAVYHDPCHLCHAQGIREAPRKLLGMITGLTLLPLPETEICCGAAGTYNLTQPEMSQRLGERKARHVLSTNAQAVLTGNAGCLPQIGRHLRERSSRMWIAHPVDALWASYSGGLPREVKKRCFD
jgi:glycolate oxidase iron-sulfur subunit